MERGSHEVPQMFPAPKLLLFSDEVEGDFEDVGIMPPEEIMLRFVLAATGQSPPNWGSAWTDGNLLTKIIEYIDPFGKVPPGVGPDWS